MNQAWKTKTKIKDMTLNRITFIFVRKMQSREIWNIEENSIKEESMNEVKVKLIYVLKIARRGNAKGIHALFWSFLA